MSHPTRTPLPRLLPLSLLIAAATCITLAAAGCGDDAPEYPEITVNEPDAAALARGATLSGAARWDGEAPQPYPIGMGSDPYCAEAGKGLKSEKYVVGPSGGLRDVFVHVTQGLDPWTFDYETEPVVINQENCVYVPHVIGVRAYQPVIFRNSDPTTHNVNTLKSGQGFNKTTSSKGSEARWQFEKPQLAIRTKCDLHPWMNAWVHVMPHPYFAVTDDEGRWTFPRALPPGTYTIEARHAAAGETSVEITIEDGKEPQPLEFHFSR
ncbi:MAG: carboxypeptidase regulatory-like domain-containing protein [Planctomycetota bacterium]|nr:carboxypeptidase regulatory-like domain-containing protein [Planctomycetota bacterium]